MILRSSIAAAALLAAAATARAELVAYWHFNTPTDGAEIEADLGDGLITIDSGWNFDHVTDFAGTPLNAFDGTPAGRDLGVKHYDNNGNYLTIRFSTSGFTDPVLSFATQRSGTGFNSNTVSYSIDNADFEEFGTYTPADDFAIQTFDFSSIDAVDDEADVFVRVEFDGATSWQGNNHIDNLQINATPASVPEPSTWLLAAALLGFAGIRLLHRNPILAFRRS